MTSKHKNQIAIFLEDCINLSKSMVAYLNPLFDHKSAKTEWGILNETLYVSRCGYLQNAGIYLVASRARGCVKFHKKLFRGDWKS